MEANTPHEIVISFSQKVSSYKFQLFSEHPPNQLIFTEIGYASAKNKPIIYLRKKDSEYSTTASGCSNYEIVYENELNLVEIMEKRLKTEMDY